MSPLFVNVFVALISGLVSPFLCIWVYAVLPFWIGDLTMALTWKSLEDPAADSLARAHASEDVAARVISFLGGMESILLIFQLTVFIPILCAVLTPVAIVLLLGLDMVVVVDPFVKMLVTPLCIILGVIVGSHLLVAIDKAMIERRKG